MRSIKKTISTTNLALAADFFLLAALVTELRLEGGDEVLVVWGLDGEASYRDQHNMEFVRFKNHLFASWYEYGTRCSGNYYHCPNPIKIVKSLFRYDIKNVCSG